MSNVHIRPRLLKHPTKPCTSLFHLPIFFLRPPLWMIHTCSVISNTPGLCTAKCAWTSCRTAPLRAPSPQLCVISPNFSGRTPLSPLANAIIAVSRFFSNFITPFSTCNICFYLLQSHTAPRRHVPACPKLHNSPQTPQSTEKH